MVFSRLFGKPKASATDAEATVSEEAVSDEPGPDEGGSDEAPAEEHPVEAWSTRARAVLVGGASTASKRPDKLYGADTEDLPTHFVRASGCRVETVDGMELVDCTMALGSVALGYAEPQLTRAVIETLANGSVSGLSPALEVEVATSLCGIIPCAERVQFLKTGADAMSAAVRIARTYTARETVVGCGYFGWHDWSSDAKGVPEAVRRKFVRVPFDDVAALERAVADASGDLAAVAIEPVIERLPSKEWIERARKLCDDKGAVLIFDEVKTGFRLALGGYQQYAEITPDLAAFGKAMANGYPLAAVCGNAALMDAAEKTWISATLASETGALAAAAAVLAWHERVDVCATLWSTGKEMRGAVAAAIDASGIAGVTVEGIDPMWFLRFGDVHVEQAFLRTALENGVLFKRGAYNFAAMAHDENALREIEAGASAAFVALQERAER
ncbi:MAG TPA: aminotransferase class III-fold pyridoxal phosphate-dependent enzyme [Gemmatimonadaceae bacterium]|nr:aminotransferase class III-fold pyridoxal phosphate-dependent enzyme [Gemmatimonadaceae bacterium]